ncbi:hypothetical protein T265_15687, partial [Opisthorchis viverrini]
MDATHHALPVFNHLAGCLFHPCLSSDFRRWRIALKNWASASGIEEVGQYYSLNFAIVQKTIHLKPWCKEEHNPNLPKIIKKPTAPTEIRNIQHMGHDLESLAKHKPRS